MPRPKRDYGESLRDDIKQLDQRLVQLGTERARKLNMLRAFESSVALDLSAVLRDLSTKSRKKPGPKPGTRRKKAKE